MLIVDEHAIHGLAVRVGSFVRESHDFAIFGEGRFRGEKQLAALLVFVGEVIADTLSGYGLCSAGLLACIRVILAICFSGDSVNLFAAIAIVTSECIVTLSPDDS